MIFNKFFEERGINSSNVIFQKLANLIGGIKKSFMVIPFEKNKTKKYYDEKLVKFEHLNWLKKLKEKNSLIFENFSNKCSNIKAREKCGIEKLRQKEGNVSFETFAKKEEDSLNYNILEIKLCLLLAENSENKVYDSKNELELKKAIKKLNLANTTLP